MDDYAGGFQATSYLVALGHRRIAFVSGPAELGSVQERYRGYRDALAKGGLDVYLDKPAGGRQGCRPRLPAARPARPPPALPGT
jgi:DNA-binding LacI/PurR family transcriptional regulator